MQGDVLCLLRKATLLCNFRAEQINARWLPTNWATEGACGYPMGERRRHRRRRRNGHIMHRLWRRQFWLRRGPPPNPCCRMWQSYKWV